ncbi:hypothetical protein JG687_00017973 [Phytophthora cactorum]|uniref:Uncharacterized protein n=1 Tax=Phytophthora cactorum TaxID=29920 RepID=A0A8T1TMW4_9STRA|nr:hypothetical protein JG687_00017973 [Phytophthora cactorum]
MLQTQRDIAKAASAQVALMEQQLVVLEKKLHIMHDQADMSLMTAPASNLTTLGNRSWLPNTTSMIVGNDHVVEYNAARHDAVDDYQPGYIPSASPIYRVVSPSVERVLKYRSSLIYILSNEWGSI